MGQTETETVVPFVRVVMPDLRDDQLRRPIDAIVRVTVEYPEDIGGTHFTNTTVVRARDLSLFVVSAHEMQVLRQYVAHPFGIRGVVIIALLSMNVLGAIALFRSRRRASS